MSIRDCFEGRHASGLRQLCLMAVLACGLLQASCGGGGAAPAPSPVVPRYDLSIAVKAPTGNVLTGVAVDFDATIINNGPDAAKGVVVTGSVPSAALARAVSCVATGGASCPSSLGLSTTIPELPSGGQLVLTFPMSFTSGVDVQVAADFRVAGESDTASGNNASAPMVQVLGSSIDLLATPLDAADANYVMTTATTAGTFGYAVTLNNAGPNPASALRVSATTDQSGAVIKLVSCTASGAALCPSLPATGPLSIVALPVGGQLNLIYHVLLPVTTRGTLNLSVEAVSQASGAVKYKSVVAPMTLDSRNDVYTAYTFYTGNEIQIALNFNSGISEAGSGTTALRHFRRLANGNYGDVLSLDQIPSRSSYGFRYKDDVVLGYVPVPSTGAAQFLAARRFRLTMPTSGSRFVQMGPGSVAGQAIAHEQMFSGPPNGLQVCRSNALISVLACNALDLVQYSLVMDASGRWTGSHSVNPNDQTTFRIAQMGSEMVLLKIDTLNGVSTFSVGLQPAGAPLASVSYPLSTIGGVGTMSISDTILDDQPVSGAPLYYGANLLAYSPSLPGIKIGANTGRQLSTTLTGSLFVMQGPLGVTTAVPNSGAGVYFDVGIP